MQLEDTLETAIEGLLDDPSFPNRQHIRSIQVHPYADWEGEDAVQALVLTDDRLATDDFAYPMTVRIRDAIAERLRQHGVTEYLYTRFVPESEYTEGFNDEDDEAVD